MRFAGLYVCVCVFQSNVGIRSRYGNFSSFLFCFSFVHYSGQFIDLVDSSARLRVSRAGRLRSAIVRSVFHPVCFSTDVICFRFPFFADASESIVSSSDAHTLPLLEFSLRISSRRGGAQNCFRHSVTETTSVALLLCRERYRVCRSLQTRIMRNVPRVVFTSVLAREEDPR